MNFDKVKKYVVVGMKFLTFIASGISAYLGIKELVDSKVSENKSNLTNEAGEDEGPSTEEPIRQEGKATSSNVLTDKGMSEKGQKVLAILGIVSSVCLGIFEVVKSLGYVTDSVDRLFHRKRYSGANRGGYIPGDYPWNTPEQRGYPNHAPIYRGQDGRQDDIYWIQREEGITEVW